jgi:hypothetical protein
MVKEILNKSDKARDITISDFMAYYQAVVTKIACYWHKNKQRPIKCSRAPRKLPICLLLPDSRQSCQKHERKDSIFNKCY